MVLFSPFRKYYDSTSNFVVTVSCNTTFNYLSLTTPSFEAAKSVVDNCTK
jgi:hypothetical protein